MQKKLKQTRQKQIRKLQIRLSLIKNLQLKKLLLPKTKQNKIQNFLTKAVYEAAEAKILTDEAEKLRKKALEDELKSKFAKDACEK